MDLNPNAIELVLERRRAQLRERLLHIGCGLRKHRLDGAKHLDCEAREIAFGDRGEIPGKHHGAPDFIGREIARLGKRFDHAAFQRALTQLAGQ